MRSMASNQHLHDVIWQLQLNITLGHMWGSGPPLDHERQVNYFGLILYLVRLVWVVAYLVDNNGYYPGRKIHRDGITYGSK